MPHVIASTTVSHAALDSSTQKFIGLVTETALLLVTQTAINNNYINLSTECVKNIGNN